MRISCLLFSFCLLLSCKSSYTASETIQNVRLSDTNVTADQEIETIIAPYRTEADARMNITIGQLDIMLHKGSPESTLGNWLADMIFDELNDRLDKKIDFAIQNQGGVRVNSLAPGTITIGEVFEIMPFDNLVAIVELDSTVTHVLLNHIAGDGGWPISKNLNLKIQEDRAIDIMINQEPLKNRTYRIAVPDYVANGGSNCDFLIGQPRMDLGLLIRDLFIEHITKENDSGIIQTATLDKRIIKLSNE